MGEGPRLQICGPFELSSPESQSPVRRLRTRKTEWLCAYLGLQRGKWLSRESLIAKFWPEDDLNAGRRKLRLALHSIRQSAGSALESEGDRVRLNDLWVDALHLPANQIEDFDFLLGEHEGFLSDLLPAFEKRWARELTELLKKAGNPDENIELALKLRGLFPQSPEAAQILREAPRRTRSPQIPSEALGRDGLLEELANHLLGGKEPVAAALIGPPGVGKTYIAKKLIPLASEEELIPVFVSLLGVRSKADLRKTAYEAIASSQGQKEGLRVSDLVSTLIIFDNADDLEPEAEGVFRELLAEGSPVRMLLTLPENRFGFCRAFRLKPLSLPKEAEQEALMASPAAQYLAKRAGVEIAQADPEALHHACMDSGGLPLALQRCAAELPFMTSAGSPSGEKRTSPIHAVADRLRMGWERLTEDQRKALCRLSHLGQKFHPSVAEAIGVASETIQDLWQSSWIQLSSEGASYELLPSVLAFAEGKRTKEDGLPPDWKDLLAGVVQRQIAANHTKMGEVFMPTLQLLERALSEAGSPPTETEGALFTAFYFCHLQRSALSEAILKGVRLYGDHPNPAWADERAVNFLGSAAFFQRDWILADRVFRHLITSRDPKMRSLGFCNAGLIAQAAGRHEEACILLAESLKTDDLLPRQKCARLNNLAHALAGAGRWEEAKASAKSALAFSQEAQDLFEVRALACITLGGICLLSQEGEKGVLWAERALAAWGEEVQAGRKIEAVFLLLCCQRTAGAQDLAQLVLKSVPKLRQGPPVQAGIWAPFAAGFLAHCEEPRSALAVLQGLPWPTTPFWLPPLFGAEPAEWDAPDDYAPSNRERWNLFLESVKHL